MLATTQAMAGQQLFYLLCFAQRAHEWHHQLHVGVTHHFTNRTHGLTFHGKAVLEGLGDVT